MISQFLEVVCIIWNFCRMAKQESWRLSKIWEIISEKSIYYEFLNSKVYRTCKQSVGSTWEPLSLYYLLTTTKCKTDQSRLNELRTARTMNCQLCDVFMHWRGVKCGHGGWEADALAMLFSKMMQRWNWPSPICALFTYAPSGARHVANMATCSSASFPAHSSYRCNLQVFPISIKLDLQWAFCTEHMISVNIHQIQS